MQVLLSKSLVLTLLMWTWVRIGAHLQADQAEADLRVAQARAETRRAMAVAEEQEMKARTQEMQAKVVGSEAEVPLAMAQAFREGKLGVFDYVNMRNIPVSYTHLTLPTILLV